MGLVREVGFIYIYIYHDISLQEADFFAQKYMTLKLPKIVRTLFMVFSDTYYLELHVGTTFDC